MPSRFTEESLYSKMVVKKDRVAGQISWSSSCNSHNQRVGKSQQEINLTGTVRKIFLHVLYPVDICDDYRICSPDSGPIDLFPELLS